MRFIKQHERTSTLIHKALPPRQAEIANITGFSESNIRVKIHRIKEKLNKKFKENE